MSGWSEERVRYQRQRSYISSSAPELETWQLESLALFFDNGFPTRHDEHWKYTDLSSIINTSYCMPCIPVEKIPSDSAMLKNDAYHIVCINGLVVYEQSDIDDLPDGVLLLETGRAMRDPKWHEYLSIDKRCRNTFSHLNAALLTGGVFIYVPKGVVLDKPVHLSYSHASIGPVMQHIRNIVVADESSQFTLIEEYMSIQEKNCFSNVVNNFFVKEGASLSHYKIQNEALAVKHVANTVVNQAADSHFFSYAFSLGASLARENLAVNLLASGACSHLYGLYLPFAGQHIDHHSCIDHAVPQCLSEQVYKGIVGTKGRAVFNGRVQVQPQAQKTTANQRNANLLLANDAEVDTKPELEIYADDVKCSHGATVGQLDQEALFYLSSRGIDSAVARELMMTAFAQEVVDHISHADIKSYIFEKIVNKMQMLS